MPVSPRLHALWQAVSSGNPAALGEFWQHISEQGAPLVETLAEDEQHVLVTFLWQAESDTRNVVVIGRFDPEHTYFQPDYFVENQLNQLLDTNLWYKTYRLRSDLRTVYQLGPNDSLVPLSKESDFRARYAKWQADVLNPHRYVTTQQMEFSVLELPNASPQPWIEPRPDVSTGTVTSHRLRSSILQNERSIWVCTPPSYTTTTEPYSLLVLFDGKEYLQAMRIATTLDNLFADGMMPPLVAVCIDSVDVATRSAELTGQSSFVHFLADEFLPWLRERYHTATEPERVIVGGCSLGGLAAAHTAFHRPALFGNVLAQSGAFNFAPADSNEYERIIHQYMNADPLPLRFHLDVGLLEVEPSYGGISLLSTNQHMRDALRTKGYPVHYREYASGHDYVNWRGTIAEGLIALLDHAP